MSNHDRYDIIIIGGGIVGLATALQILRKDPRKRLLLLEKESSVARHQTGHNSGVLHSGIYYTPGSLKAKNCREGYTMMVKFCQDNDIPHEICGKVIVAANMQDLPQLQLLKDKGNANGLNGIRVMSREEIREVEPHVNGLQGLFVPQTGITDFTIVAERMKHLIMELGGIIRLNERVLGINENSKGVLVITDHNEYSGMVIISCAGLHSDRIARWTQKDLPLRIVPFRGEYYRIKNEKKHLVRNLVYPVPDPAFPFLGVHFTRMIDGGVEAGPNAVFAFAREGYQRTSFNMRDTLESLAWPGFQKIAMKYWRTGAGEFYRSFSKPAFTRALQKLVPEIQEDDLEEGGSGVRAQACDIAGNLLNDFFILEDKNIIHVCNAPSPAATSSLSIGHNIAKKVLRHF